MNALALTRTQCVSDYRPSDEFIPGSPAAFDDNTYALDEAYTDAEAQLMATGYAVSLAASEACPNSTADMVTPYDLLNTDDYHAIGRPMHELMAVMASGTLAAAEIAMREWRDRLPALMALDISSRADELMAQEVPA